MKMKDIYARDVGWSILDIDFSLDQQWMIYSSWSSYVQLCNLTGDDEIHETFYVGSNHIGWFSIKFSPDNREILCGNNERDITLFDLETQKVSLQFEAHENDINTVCYAEPNSNDIIYSGSDDSLCKIWDRRMLQSSNMPAGILRGHLDGITYIDSKNDGRYFISNSKDQSIKLWDIRKMGGPNSSHLMPKRRKYHDYRNVRPIPTRFETHPHDQSLKTFRGHKVFQTLIRCYFSPVVTTAQRYIYSGSYDGIVYIFDTLTGNVVNTLSDHLATVRDLSWHPYEPLIASSSWDATVKIWNMTHRQHPGRNLMHH